MQNRNIIDRLIENFNVTPSTGVRMVLSYEEIAIIFEALKYYKNRECKEKEIGDLCETVQAQTDLIDKMIIDRIAITDIMEIIEKYYNCKIDFNDKM